jgi:hypothetical protein
MIESFHFSPAYRVKVDPEFPGDGDWRLPVFGFDRDGRVVRKFESRWGVPLIVRVTATQAGWVGMFAAGGLGGVRGVFAAPSRAVLCAVVDGLAYLVDVEAPANGAVIAHDQVRQVVPVPGRDLLLLVRMIDIVALGPEGIAWRSTRLAVDDLRVVQATADAIVCSAWMLEDKAEELTLNPSTGAILEGRRLDYPWN